MLIFFFENVGKRNIHQFEYALKKLFIPVMLDLVNFLYKMFLSNFQFGRKFNDKSQEDQLITTRHENLGSGFFLHFQDVRIKI